MIVMSRLYEHLDGPVYFHITSLGCRFEASGKGWVTSLTQSIWLGNRT